MKPITLLLAKAGLVWLAGITLLQAAPALRIGVSDSDSAPVVELSGTQLVGGLSKALGEALGQTLKAPVEFVVVSRKRVELAVDSGQIDIICNSNPAWYAGAARVGWTREFYPQVERVMSLKQHPRTFSSLEELSGQRIGVIAGYHYTAVEPLWQAQRAVRINQPRLPLLMRALQTGMVDVVINSELEMGAWLHANPALAANMRLHPLIVSSTPTRCAVSPASRYSVTALDQAIATMEQDGVIRRILTNYEWKNR